MADKIDFYHSDWQDWPLEPRKMTPDQFFKQINAAFDDDGTECGHARADAIMCELLMALGYSEGVEVFNAHTKWYS